MTLLDYNNSNSFFQDGGLLSKKKLGLAFKTLMKCCSFHTEVFLLLQTDDDVYLNIPVLVDVLLEQEKTAKDPSKTMIGHRFDGMGPIRSSSVFNIERKWICPTWMFSDDIFPNYMSGAG